MKRQPQQSRVLIVSFEQLKKLEKYCKDNSVLLSFGFAMQGKYAIYRNVELLEGVLNG